MPRSVTSIQAEITVLEAFLASDKSTLSATASDGTSVNFTNRESATKRLDTLYRQKDLASGRKRFVRGYVTGLRGR